jgi:hypothetical protein
MWSFEVWIINLSQLQQATHPETNPTFWACVTFFMLRGYVFMNHILLFWYLTFTNANAQELDTVDRSCRTVNSESKPVYCHEIEGTEISDRRKRDIGMMLEVIITYNNKYTTLVIYCLAITFHTRTRVIDDGFGVIPTRRTPTQALIPEDISYTIEVKYVLLLRLVSDVDWNLVFFITGSVSWLFVVALVFIISIQFITNSRETTCTNLVLDTMRSVPCKVRTWRIASTIDCTVSELTLFKLVFFRKNAKSIRIQLGAPNVLIHLFCADSDVDYFLLILLCRLVWF